MKVRVILLLGLLLVLAGALESASVQAQQSDGQAYVIQRSDSLWKLAEKYLGDGNLYPLILQATASKARDDPSFAEITAADVIHPGQKIWIPAQGNLPATATEATAAPLTAVDLPAGHIAFSFWNPAPSRCTYEIDIIAVPVCLRSGAKCQATRRIFPLNNASEPALSPDGQRLAFRGWGAIPDELQPGQAHPYKDCAKPTAERWLQVASLDGTDVRSVTGYFEDSHPDWSPDGKRVLFDTARLGDGVSRIMFFYADGSGEEELRIAGQQPSWAPDNDRFVFRGCDLTGNRCGLWLARAVPVKSWETGANLIGPVLEEPEAAHPDWSPTGDEIVYQSPVGGSWDLYVIRADGTGKRRLTSNPAIEGLPAWSPDGQWIAYLSDQGGNWGLWVIPAAGGQPRQLFAFDGGQFRPAAVEPYGVRDWLDEQISWSR